MAGSGKQDLTRGPVGAHLRRQATPFALGLVAIFSFEAADLFFISRLGHAPLAAVSFTMPVIWLIYGIGIGFEAGAASCVSRAVGRKDHRHARRLTTDTVVLAALVMMEMRLRLTIVETSSHQGCFRVVWLGKVSVAGAAMALGRVPIMFLSVAMAAALVMVAMSTLPTAVSLKPAMKADKASSHKASAVAAEVALDQVPGLPPSVAMALVPVPAVR